MNLEFLILESLTDTRTALIKKLIQTVETFFIAFDILLITRTGSSQQALAHNRTTQSVTARFFVVKLLSPGLFVEKQRNKNSENEVFDCIHRKNNWKSSK